MILKIIGLALLLAIMAILLRSFGFKGAGAFAAFAVVAVFSAVSGELASIGDLLGNSSLFDGEASEYASAIIKLVGAGYLFGICSDVCRELGEVGIANGVTAAGRVEIFVLTLPYLGRILELGAELIK